MREDEGAADSVKDIIVLTGERTVVGSKALEPMELRKAL
jgi:hypothetical protein